MNRRAIQVRGVVQGVGFRPFVYHLATECGLRGFVRNEQGNVQIEVEGAADALDRFLNQLVHHPPPLALVQEVHWVPCPVVGEPQFRIEPSAPPENQTATLADIAISADVATCAECLAELFDPLDRRYRYPFLNCTNCGPRLTIVRGVPYDRARTTLADFPLCALCRAEYDNPDDRRFHAQPTACPVCGPQLQLLDAHGTVCVTDDPIQAVADALRAGKIVALKGLGGYHLACAANDAESVRGLRQRKHRDEKPFAVMAVDLNHAQTLCEISAAEANLLLSPRRPIVLLHRLPQAAVAEAVAPRNPQLGLLLPYTPLHHLLLRAVAMPLVMTSGNHSDEPIVYHDEEVIPRLAGIADFFLTHNRPIQLRCDDSVTRMVAGAEAPLRRSRGYAPLPLALPFDCPVPILAVGGQLKNVFALGRQRQAILGHHIGDLGHYAAYKAFVEAIAHYEQLFAFQPQLLVHDLHPDYSSTRYASQRSGAVPLLAVQHHHAHLASCMVEHGLTEPVIGVLFDGTGYGLPDANGAVTIWGGEFLVGDYRTWRRAGHLRNVAMPGGEQAILQPWRMALAYLEDAGETASVISDSVPAASLRTVQQMLARQLNAPLTSSAGRLFDAVAALLGVRAEVSYEGQAAIELEGLAQTTAGAEPYPFLLEESVLHAETPASLSVDTRPLFRALVAALRSAEPRAQSARRFHVTVAEMIVQVCVRLRQQTGLQRVVLSGGVFLNALLTELTVGRLETVGFTVYRHQRVPTNDGGLCLGQLAIGAAHLAAGHTPSHNFSA